MIKSFDDTLAQQFFEGNFAGDGYWRQSVAKWFQGDKERLTRCLTLLDCAATPRDLAGLPSYRLSQGWLHGRYSIQFDQCIVFFSWTPVGEPSEVKLVGCA